MIKLRNKKFALFDINSTSQLFIWWGISFLVQFIVLHHLHYSFRFSIIDALITNLILLIVSIELKQIQKYFHSKYPISFIQTVLLVVFTIFTVSVYRYVGAYFLPKDEWNLYPTLPTNLIRGIIIFLLLYLVLFQLWINKNHSFNEKNTLRLLEIERQLNKAELVNIQQQLQPHFLFNSLNSISALTVVQPEEARRMVHLLSDFLRGTLRKDHEQLIKLSEELTYLNLYLEIEKVRFGHRLHIEIEVNESCSEAFIPTFILQPIVENSIKYGLYGQVGDLTISLKAICKNNQLILSISNPYDPETVNASKGIGFGLSSIQKKLYLLFGQNDLVHIDKTANQFTTTLVIPQK